jgi:methanogenic corrinoid protein MtbC1
MIRWCAYCQRYQGEVDPFDEYSLTHTICEACEARAAYLRKEPPSLESIRHFLGRMARIGTGPGPTAAELVAQGAALGLDPDDLLLGVVQPVLHRIGERWARAEATIAEEHRVTALCAAVIERIAEADPKVVELRQAQRPDVLLVVAEGNQHTLGIQILEALLIRSRISTFTLYPGLPADETVQLARSLAPRVVAISAALPEQLEPALRVAERLADSPAEERPLVAVGGFALRADPSLRVGAPLVPCRDPRELLELASRPRAAAGAERPLHPAPLRTGSSRGPRSQRS